MKRDPKTNVLASREFYSAGSLFFLALGLGAVVARHLNADLVFYLGMGAAVLLGVLQSRFACDSDAAVRREEHLDALRWRALQENREFPIIEDVKQLRDAGCKIEAIKLYRQLNPDADLRAALDAVDLM